MREVHLAMRRFLPALREQHCQSTGTSVSWNFSDVSAFFAVAALSTMPDFSSAAIVERNACPCLIDVPVFANARSVFFAPETFYRVWEGSHRRFTARAKTGRKFTAPPYICFASAHVSSSLLRCFMLEAVRSVLHANKNLCKFIDHKQPPCLVSLLKNHCVF